MKPNNGSTASVYSWRADMVWKMRRRIFNALRPLMQAEDYRRWHEWIDGFAQQTTDARCNDPGVPEATEPVDDRGHAVDERKRMGPIP